jgi:NAD(P)-dependent dehydrogenase (short-subunit alcohol dehydrogenase family)
VRPKIAFVTGASRGIGRACAQHLARVGFDVAISARTEQEGEAREHSSTLRRSSVTPLPGSLASTADLVRAEGRNVLAVSADLLDAGSLCAAASMIIDRWGGVDVLVHSGRYIGPGTMDQFIETPLELIQREIFANVIGPLILNKEFLPGMVRRGRGIIVNITSGVAYADPTRSAGEGGWGMGYALSKGAFHRIAGVLAVELADRGIMCFNVQPNQIATERLAAHDGEFGINNIGAPPEVVAAVVAWLVTDPGAREFNGGNVEAQFFCHDRGLLPTWDGPEPNEAPIKYDLGGNALLDLENALRISRGVATI